MSSNLQAVQQALEKARSTHELQDALAPGLHLTSSQDAYAVQHAMGRAQSWWRDGLPRYWKSGAASRSALQTHAPLPDDGVWTSPADARAWPPHARGIEAEIALRLVQDVAPEMAATIDLMQARRLVGAMAVSIELVDFRWRQQMQAPELLKLADLQSHGALVLGNWQPYEDRDWARQRARVTLGAQPPVEREGSHSLGDPSWVLPQWLRHATQHFGVLPAGTVVTTGTWVGLLHAQPGDLVTVQFDGFGEASVQL